MELLFFRLCDSKDVYLCTDTKCIEDSERRKVWLGVVVTKGECEEGNENKKAEIS